VDRVTKRRPQNLLESFNFAFEGIIHVLRTQRNLRIHFLAAVLVFGAAIAVGVTRLQLIALVLAIAFVLVSSSAIPSAIAAPPASNEADALVAQGVNPERIRLLPPVNVTGTGADDEARRVDIAVGK